MKTLFTYDARWARAILFGLIFALLPIAIDYWSIWSSERNDYFHYTETVVLKESVASTDDVIKVFSYLTVSKPVTLRYKDVLRCNSGDGFEFTDSNETSSLAKPGVYPITVINEQGELVPVPWRFSVDANLIQGERCRIDSTVTASPGFNFQFSQEITSNVFTIQ